MRDRPGPSLKARTTSWTKTWFKKCPRLLETGPRPTRYPHARTRTIVEKSRFSWKMVYVTWMNWKVRIEVVFDPRITKSRVSNVRCYRVSRRWQLCTYEALSLEREILSGRYTICTGRPGWLCECNSPFLWNWCITNPVGMGMLFIPEKAHMWSNIWLILSALYAHAKD